MQIEQIRYELQEIKNNTACNLYNKDELWVAIERDAQLRFWEAESEYSRRQR